jgi:hypothetical protein
LKLADGWSAATLLFALWRPWALAKFIGVEPSRATV